MGKGLSKLFKKGKEQRIVMLGLDNAGKTTILYKIKMGEVIQTTPTIGTLCLSTSRRPHPALIQASTSRLLRARTSPFQCGTSVARTRSVAADHAFFGIADPSPQIRGLWRHYFLNTQAVVFVVDSNDGTRLKVRLCRLGRVRV